MPKAHKTAGGLGGAVSPPVGPGQSPGWGSGGKAPQNFRVFLWEMKKNIVSEGENTIKDNTTIVFFLNSQVRLGHVTAIFSDWKYK